MTYEIHNEDCLKAMASMESDSVDALVTDPPYAIGLAGSKWDTFGGSMGNQTVSERQAEGKRYASENKGAPHYANSHGKRPTHDEMVAFQAYMTPIFSEALRVAKPGAHMLCFGGTRTFHRMACAMEDAGWYIKDCIMWTYGSGMPHGMNVARAVEKIDPERAAEWEGYNTHLKPSWEPIIVAVKPMRQSVAKNVLEYGTGAINIDACRVPTNEKLGGGMKAGGSDGSWHRPFMDDPEKQAAFVERKKAHIKKAEQLGRWPANLIHDGSDEVRACFPDAKGQQGNVRDGVGDGKSVCYGDYGPRGEFIKRIEEDKSAARFFYCAKASKKDRGEFNDHVSVKPNALMRYLVKLICRPGGAVLDPFMGSGSTGVACMQEDMRFIGCELDAHYCEIAERRISAVQEEHDQMALF